MIFYNHLAFSHFFYLTIMIKNNYLWEVKEIMLTFWEIAEVLEATNDWKKWDNFSITGIEFDSRLIQRGNLFIPLQGEKDGHQFIDGAVKKEASATLWDSKNKFRPNIPFILVENTLVAMQQLAMYYLQKIKPTVISITGSNGKTTTKDLTYSVLSQRFHTYKTQGNYNNDIGLPYTILHMPKNTEKLILEMGMDHAGEIAFLSKLAQPDVAAITMIGEAHIENLGSKEGIAKAKMEIVEGLSNEGLLIVPAQIEVLDNLLTKIKQKIATFGLKSGDYQAIIVDETKSSMSFTVKGMTEIFTIPIPGKYNVENALITIAIGNYFQLSEQEISIGLANVELTKNRTQWLKTKQNIELLSDVYNANPTAMKLVLEGFAQMSVQGKRMVVLADMLELGQESQQMHESIAQYLDPLAISEVFLYGEQMKFLYDKLQNKYAKEKLYYFSIEEKKQLLMQLKKNSKEKDSILLKGSNSMGLQEVVVQMMEE